MDNLGGGESGREHGKGCAPRPMQGFRWMQSALGTRCSVRPSLEGAASCPLMWVLKAAPRRAGQKHTLPSCPPNSGGGPATTGPGPRAHTSQCVYVCVRREQCCDSPRPVLPPWPVSPPLSGRRVGGEVGVSGLGWEQGCLGGHGPRGPCAWKEGPSSYSRRVGFLFSFCARLVFGPSDVLLL